MKTSIQLIYFFSSFLLLLSGCTKKNTSMSPDKKKAAVAQKAPDTKSPTPKPLETPGTQALPPIDEPAIETPVVDSPSIANESFANTETSQGPAPTANPTMSAANSANASAAAPSPSPLVQNTPPAAAPALPPAPAQTIASIFEKCLTDNVAAMVSTLKALAPKEPTPSSLLAIKNLLQKTCALKLGDKGQDIDFNQFETSKKIVVEAMKSFPQFEPIIRFFNAIEANPAIAPEQKENIYKYYGSGGEISSKDIRFYGKLEGSKASSHVISYLITSATGTRSTRVFISDKEIKKTVTDLKSAPKPSNRYTFDFTPTQNNTYTLNISNGEAKIVAKVTFVKGDIKTLRERKAVTVALTAESWSKVQEEHLRRLISSEAKELISMPFSLEREQDNMSLVRTCSLDADNIACTDPDFISRAVVRSSVKASGMGAAKASKSTSAEGE